MNKYLYFGVIVPINEIIENEADDSKEEFNCRVLTYCGKNFDRVFDNFLESITETDGEGFVCRLGMDNNEMPTEDYMVISKTNNCLNLNDCFDVRIIKTIKNRRTLFDAKAQLNDYGEKHLFNMLKSIIIKNNPVKKQEPLEMPISVLSHFEDVIEEQTGAQIIDEVFYLSCIEISLSNTDKLVLYKNSQGQYDWDQYTESYWFKNKERLIKEYNEYYSICN